MSIASIVRNGKGKAGSNASWSVESKGDVHFLYHYTTLMLEWEDDGRGGAYITYTSLGHGSVSDQGGMNRAFKVLGSRLYYSRQGGAAIIKRR